jgi:hypothetical protein
VDAAIASLPSNSQQGCILSAVAVALSLASSAPAEEQKFTTIGIGVDQCGRRCVLFCLVISSA